MEFVLPLPAAKNTVTLRLTAWRIASESVLFGVMPQEQEIMRPRSAAQLKVWAHVSQVCAPAALSGTIWQFGAIPTTP